MIDLATRMVVGWQLAEHMRPSLATDALAMAITGGHARAGVIFHSDRGCQGGFKRSSQHWFSGVNIAPCGVLRREFSNRVLCGVVC